MPHFSYSLIHVRHFLFFKRVLEPDLAGVLVEPVDDGFLLHAHRAPELAVLAPLRVHARAAAAAPPALLR